MSKLDEIYFDIHYANPPHDKIFMINIKNDLVYQAFKDELKDLLLELVGKDEKELVRDPHHGSNAMDGVAINRNALRAELRKKVEEL